MMLTRYYAPGSSSMASQSALAQAAAEFRFLSDAAIKIGQPERAARASVGSAVREGSSRWSALPLQAGRRAIF
jgi:hypothetical protein